MASCSSRRAAGVAAAALASSVWSAGAHAWILTLNPGPTQIFMAVGNTAVPAANVATVNTVSVNVPTGSIGNGVALAMTSNSTQGASPYDNYPVCNPPAQVYIGGYYRQPNSGSGAAAATLQVTTPASLSNGTNSIAFSQISWTSTANGDSAADIAPGTFNGGTQLLANFARNTFVENCFTYSYANATVPPAGTYTGVAVFTLSVP